MHRWLQLLASLALLLSCSSLASKDDSSTPAPLTARCDADLYARALPRQTLPTTDRLNEVLQRQTPLMRAALLEKGMCLGQPIYLRIFKSEQRLEVWVKREARYEKFRSYPICTFSGDLGPKQRSGDFQAPEGLYEVGVQQLNPNSRFHLSFNLGYPNAYERAHGWTGDALMVHGSCVSIGCYAMTDPGIEEIYTLVHYALRHAQPRVPVHVFPFQLTAEALEAQRQSPWYAFWKELQPAYDRFELKGVPPTWRLEGNHYQIQ